MIALEKTSSSTQEHLASVTDYLVWYARKRPSLKFRQLFLEKMAGRAGGTGYTRVEKRDGRCTALNQETKEKGDRIYSVGDLTSQTVGREKGEGASRPVDTDR